MKKAVIFFLPAVFVISSCRKPETVAYRENMRRFVEQISSIGRARHPGFMVIPQNGHNLITSDGTASGSLETDYLNAIDGMGREDLFYGYENDDEATPATDRDEMLGLLRRARQSGVTVMTTDYCSSPGKMDDSYAQNAAEQFISFAASDRNLAVIPSYPAQPYQVNTSDIDSLSQAKNFLYLINPENYSDKASFIAALAATDYDVLLIDLFFEDQALTTSDLAQLRNKAHGGRRLIIAYMSIGEAEDYRWYWQPHWKARPPSFIAGQNPDWPGNYRVRYWDTEWQNIICNGPDSYLSKITGAGFDGVYLDIIDAYETFER